jgi:AAA+ superfamily predicted ATPase
MIERATSVALSIGFYLGNMDSSIQTYTDKELTNRLQELMENPRPIKDGPYSDSDEKLSSFNIVTKNLKDIRLIKLSLSTSNSTAYTDGSIAVNIQLRKGALIKEGRFSCYVYTEDYSPMCNSDATYKFDREASNKASIVMLSFRIWLPGNYFLLVRDKTNGSLLRIDFEISKLMNIMQRPLVMRPICSIDDILTTSIENSESNWDILSTTPGTFELRRYALEFRRLKIYNEFRKGLNGRELKTSSNLLIYTTNRDWNAEILQSFQKIVVPGYYYTQVDCNTLYNAALQNPFEPLNEKLNNTTNQVFCLISPGALLNTGGKVVVRQIVEKICEDKEKYKLWLCGGKQEIESVLDVYPSLKDLFLSGNVLSQQPYSGFELVQAFIKELYDEHLDPSETTMDALARAILQHHEQGCFSTWSLSSIRRFIAEEVSPRYLRRAIDAVMSEKQSLPELPIEDIPFNLLPNSTSEFEDSIKELNEMVGLDDVKKSITTMANQSRFFIERKKAGLCTSNVAAQHAIFTGNPGTGKTTVARMLGKIYHSIGLLSKGDVICADRTRLVGCYIGETEENMKAVLEEARGNVLFIDEAYNLYEGTADRKDYGAKVIDSLLTVLSQPNPDMVIIFAGYEKEMDAMLNSNPGLMGRFPYKYRFSDYDADQLMQIALHLLAKDDYILCHEAHDILRQKISDTLAQRTKNFGNARWVEQFIRNGIIPAMANRVTQDTLKDYQHILPSDVEEGYQKFNPRMIELKPRRQVGFNA